MEERMHGAEHAGVTNRATAIKIPHAGARWRPAPRRSPIETMGGPLRPGRRVVLGEKVAARVTPVSAVVAVRKTPACRRHRQDCAEESSTDVFEASNRVNEMFTFGLPNAP